MSPMQWMSGTELSQKRRQLLIDSLDHYVLKPKLCILLVGHDEASELYVNVKIKASEEVGIDANCHHLPNTTTQSCIEWIERCNQDPTIHGIMVQLPLPKHIDSQRVLSSIALSKDVDGLSPLQSRYQPTFVPCTPLAIMQLLDHYKIALRHQCVTLIGTSRLIGRPLMDYFLDQGATLNMCHQWTQQATTRNDLAYCIKRADVLISATGQQNIIKPEWIKHNSVVMDVGIHRINGRTYGDLNHQHLNHVKWLTPVPGGIGPMTVTCLLDNTVSAFLTTQA